MKHEEIIKKIRKKREFSELPEIDVEIAYSKFKKRQTSDEDKIKLTRDLLGKVFFYFSSRKLLNKKIIDKKSSDDVLKKHLSTRERFPYYTEIYEKLLRKDSKVSVFDLGAGINGLSYKYFPKKVNYIGAESVGQLVELMNYYFQKNSIKDARALKLSLFEIEKIKELIKKTKGKKIVFLFKIVDSLEIFERNFTKRLLKEIVPLVDEVVVSFATESLVKREKFKVKRFWFENFVKREFDLIEIFEIGSEKYFVFKKKN